MTKENKQMFTRRITQANRTQLVVILYEMLLVYLEDAQKAHAAEDQQEFVRNLELARECISEMRTSLNFDYELSKNLFAIYCFADKELASDIFGNKTENLDALKTIFTKLHDAYATISEQDETGPLMDNIQDVYAGLTYGKGDINESLVNYDTGRGYTV